MSFLDEIFDEPAMVIRQSHTVPIAFRINEMLLNSKADTGSFQTLVNSATDEANPFGVGHQVRLATQPVLCAVTSFTFFNSRNSFTNLHSNFRKTANRYSDNSTRSPTRTPQNFDKMLQQGVIVPSTSPWTSNCFFVAKEINDWRLVMNYVPLNRQMVPDRYPLPLLWEIVQSFAGKKIYSTLDLAAGFWNCPIGEESRKYTSFVCQLGQFEYTILSIGIRNSPAHMQRSMDVIFGDIFCLHGRHKNCYK
eukprot:GHVP01059031.1.p1 GENE.GHVP01059031.1~~GHVP01059031.1.p1  ORF type:complete len:250 (-),score=11.80 GHVP01059031.1:575-1324(-)